MTEKSEIKPNKLVNEKSPYLLQHAYNPVDWYPWGSEAILKAKSENKPIILSIGYSTCHWCHVMEKESFENDHIAGIMNENFVCIKLDREERPDIDNIYMSAVNALTGSGGWPLNVFLTPDLKPFFGGTYFPAQSRYQMISWPDLLLRISDIWKNPSERQNLLMTGEKLAAGLEAHLSGTPRENKVFDLNLEVLESGFSHYLSQHDSQFGGFGQAPKFPSPVIQNFLSMYYYGLRKNDGSAERQDQVLSLLISTLKNMANGGIYDHVGGGFHRYSTDQYWHIPHFEKMLYDNAQLIINYCDAYLMTSDSDFRSIAKKTADYLLRDMLHPEGGFYSAEDADSLPLKRHGKGEKIEGSFYVWEYEEIKNLLDDKTADVFCYHYGVKPGGNARLDPHGDFKGKSILFVARSLEETANQFDLAKSEAQQLLDKAINVLFVERNKRPRPHLDDKIITSWNGLTISALSRAYQVENDPRYLMAAQKAAGFVYRHLYDPHRKQLYRIWREGEKKIKGMAEDYAFFIQGLLDLYESDFNLDWLKWALALCERQMLDFYDDLHDGFFLTAKSNETHLILRAKEENDAVIPSANSISAINLIRLSRYFNRDDLYEKAKKTMMFFGDKMNRYPAAMPQMLVALEMYFSKPNQIAIVGNGTDESVENFRKIAHSTYHPGMMMFCFKNKKNQKRVAEILPTIGQMAPIEGKATAYVCSDFTCKAPTADLVTFKKNISAE